MPKKISQLPAASNVAAVDTLAIVQGGATKQASVGQLIANGFRRPQVVTTRCTLPNTTWGNGAGGRSDTRVENRVKYYLGRQDVTQLSVAMAGFYIDAANGDNQFTADVSYEAAVELTSPAMYHRAYTFGAAIGTVAKGAPFVQSHPLPFDLAAGSNFWLRHSCSVAASTQTIPSCSTPAALGDTGFVSAAASSQVAGTGNMTTPSGGASFGGPYASMILGVPVAPMASVAFVGDSIADGNGDTADTYGNCGFISRGLYSVGGYPVPWIKQTVGSWSFSKCTIDTAPRLRTMWPYVTHVMIQLGTNDIATGATLSALQTYATNLWRAAKRVIGPYGKAQHVTQVLIMPRTSSTDGWATAANQTPLSGFASGGVRDQFNAWVKTQVGLGLLDAYIDPNTAVEDATNPGKWLTNGSAGLVTADGVHPNGNGHLLASATVNSWALAIAP